MTPPVALTIAGSDSGGGAGVQADLRTFAAHGAYGATAVTAVTAQDTTRVYQVHAVPTDVVVAQIDAVIGDLAVSAVKTGMLATTETLAAVADLAARRLLPRLVVDPVLVSSTGQPLLETGAQQGYLEQLLPHATVVTPNLAEAEALLGFPVRTLSDMRDAAAALAQLGPDVVITGGHLAENAEETVDVLHCGGTTYELRGPRVDTRHTHGTGCTFSAALAARLAHGDDVLTATRAAQHYVTAALAAAAHWRIGHGAGPLDHSIPTLEESR